MRHFKSSTTPEDNKTNLYLQTKTPQMFFLNLAEKNETWKLKIFELKGSHRAEEKNLLQVPPATATHSLALICDMSH